jgi:hypothetical protein
MEREVGAHLDSLLKTEEGFRAGPRTGTGFCTEEARLCSSFPRKAGHRAFS